MLRFLLLQIRDPDDDMRDHEIRCFARVAATSREAIDIHDLLNEPLSVEHLANIDCVFVGGSGDYSVVGDATWLDRALDSLRLLHASKVPTFASCWGHQAMARALGGKVVHAAEFAEVGSIEMSVTEAGRKDSIFGSLGTTFFAQVGHEDTVVELPPRTTLLAYSNRCPVHAFRFEDAPIYCTQFHPELSREDLLLRVESYPRYVESIAGMPMAEFRNQMRPSEAASGLIGHFLTHFSNTPGSEAPPE